MKRPIVLATFVILAGCSFKTRAELAAEDSARTQEQTTVAQQRSTASDAPADAGTATPTATKTIVKQAPVEEDIDTQMRNLNGRVDTLENTVKQQDADKQGDLDKVAKEKAAIDQKFKDYEEALKKLETQVQALNDEVTKLKTAPPPPPPAPPVAEEKAEAKKTAYQEGEEHFAQKKWKDAIVSYQKFRDAAPKAKKYADATYKIGVCFQELGMKDEARAFYEEVGAKFPKTSEARKAGIRLKSLK